MTRWERKPGVGKTLLQTGLAAGFVMTAASLVLPELAQRESGRAQVFDRTEDGFIEATQVTEPMVPRDHAVLYCVPQQQQIYMGNMRVDRDADGSVYVLRNANIPDPGQLYDRFTLPPADYRIEPVALAQRRTLGADLLAACQNLNAQVSASRPVSRIVAQLGL